MIRSHVFLLPAGLILLATPGIKAEQAGERESRQVAEREIRQLEDGINRAIVEGDVAFFDCILAEDFTHTSQSGKFRTRAEWMKGREQGNSTYQSFETEDVQIRIYSDTAVVTGLSAAKWREADGQAQSGQYRFLRIWVRRDEGWQAVAFQSTATRGAGRRSERPLKFREMQMHRLVYLTTMVAFGLAGTGPLAGAEAPTATKEFEIKDDRPYLGGKQIDLWGLRCGNALYSVAVTERHIRNLDNMVAHGINCIGVYVQGSNAGWPDANANKNGYTPDGGLKPDFAERLEWLVREADNRGMVVMVGLFSPRKDQEFNDEAAVHRAVEETAKFLVERKLRNVFCDIMHEYNHERIDMEIFREPHGTEKKAKLTGWFKRHAPDIEAGICPTFKSDTGDSYRGMDVRIVQKEAEIPRDGFVVNVETQRHDGYDNDGKFELEEFPIMFGYFEQYRDAPNAVMLFHSGFCQGITNKSGTAPHPEMGGYGKSEDDRGIRFYYEWVRDNIGRYEYPKHVKD